MGIRREARDKRRKITGGDRVCFVVGHTKVPWGRHRAVPPRFTGQFV